MGRTKKGAVSKQKQPLIDVTLQRRRSSRNSSNKIDGKNDNYLLLELGKGSTARVANVNTKSKECSQKKAEPSSIKKQDDISDDDKKAVLKNFDLTPCYGPCRGISRRERYLRAIRFNLQPTPTKEIITILDEHEGDFTFQKCIWDQNELLKLHV